MKTPFLSIALSALFLACAKPIPPNSEPVKAEEPASVSFLGTWYDERGGTLHIHQDGSVKDKHLERAAEVAGGVCTQAGFDISDCEDPLFLWKAHPSEEDSFVFVIRMPMTTGGTPENPAECFCLDAGILMIARLVENHLEVEAVGPDGSAIPGTSRFNLTRVAPEP